MQTAIKLDHPYSLSDQTLRCYLARSGFSIQATRSATDNHLAYLCRPGPVTPDALPTPAAVAAEWYGFREAETPSP